MNDACSRLLLLNRGHHNHTTTTNATTTETTTTLTTTTATTTTTAAFTAITSSSQGVLENTPVTLSQTPSLSIPKISVRWHLIIRLVLTPRCQKRSGLCQDSCDYRLRSSLLTLWPPASLPILQWSCTLMAKIDCMHNLCFFCFHISSAALVGMPQEEAK